MAMTFVLCSIPIGWIERGTTMISLRPRILMAAAAVALLVGCAGGGSASNPFQQPSQREQEVKIFVLNLAFMDATVWSVTNGGRRRLGQVTGKRETVFTVPLTHTVEMYLEVDILAGPRCFTERLFVDPGDHLELELNTNNPYLICREG
jgi:hypothetical protein